MKPASAATAKEKAAGKAAKTPPRRARTASSPEEARAQMGVSETAGGAEKGRPPAVKKPRNPDDLKLISGVGPKLEGVLNGLGIYTYAQVAAWKKALKGS